jgi:hypothetical protein
MGTEAFEQLAGVRHWLLDVEGTLAANCVSSPTIPRTRTTI